MPAIVLKCLDETIEYCAAHYGKDKSFPENIESLVLSRIYAYTNLKDDKNYSWHIFVSEVHDPNQASLRALHTNHDILIRESSKRADAPGLTQLSQPNIHLRYYSKHVCLFKLHNV